jgi:hypothetical protein
MDHEARRRRAPELLDLVRFEADPPRRSVDARTAPGEQVEGAVTEDLEAHVAEDPEASLVDRLDLVD